MFGLWYIPNARIAPIDHGISGFLPLLHAAEKRTHAGMALLIQFERQTGAR